MGNELVVVSKDTLRGVLSEDPAVKRDALAVLRDQPVQALQLLKNPIAAGLSAQAAAIVLDEVAAVLPGEEVAAVLAENLTPERLAELLAERGDLGSTAVLVASRDSVLQAMLMEMEDVHPVDVAVTLFYWAHKLRDRDDWEEFLEICIGDGEKSIRWYLLMYIWNQAGRPGLSDAEVVEEDEDDEDDDRPETICRISPSNFIDVGLDVEESREALAELFVAGETERWNRKMLFEAMDDWQQRRSAPLVESKLPPDWQKIAALPEGSDALAKEIEDELS